VKIFCLMHQFRDWSLCRNNYARDAELVGYKRAQLRHDTTFQTVAAAWRLQAASAD
jgi:hypothetical protein